jgi:hypothetical protein
MLSLALFTFTACYLRLFVSLNVPILPSGDQITPVSDAARIVAGELPYRDFFVMLPAGAPLTYALLIKAFGLCIWIPGVVMACLATTTVLLMTLASSRLMRGRVVALPAVLFTGFILLLSADASHHWFSTVFVLTAMVLLFGDTTPWRIAAVGACCGAAACFTQTKGAMALVAVTAYLVWKASRRDFTARECWRHCLLLGGAAVAVFAAVNSYFIGVAGLTRWFYCVLAYPLRYYSVPAINNWRVIKYDFQWHQGAARWLAFPFVYCTVPLVYIAFPFAMRLRRGKVGTQSHDRLILVALTGIAMFLAIASSPSVKRLSTVSPPAMILLAWLLDRPGRTAPLLRTALGTAAVAVAISVAVRSQTRWVTYLDLPAGRTAFIERSVHEEYCWVLAHTHPGQFFWGMPPFNLPFHLQNPARIMGYDTTEYTRPEEVAALVQALQEHSVPVIVLPSEIRYPLTVEGPSNHLAPFVSYLRTNYKMIRTFANGDEVWERTGSSGS